MLGVQKQIAFSKASVKRPPGAQKQLDRSQLKMGGGL